MGLISKIEDKLAGNSQAKEERKLEERGQTGKWLPEQSGHDNSGVTSGTGRNTGSSFQHPIGSSGTGPTGSAVGGHESSMADRARGEGYGNTQGYSGNHGYSGTQAYPNDRPTTTERLRDDLPGNHSNTQGYTNTPGHSNTLGHSTSQGHSTIDSNNRALAGNQGHTTQTVTTTNTASHRDKPSMMERAREALPGNHSNTQAHSGNQGYSAVDSNYNNNPTMTERAREDLPGNHGPQGHRIATGSHGVDQYTSSGQRAAAMAGEDRGATRTTHGGMANTAAVAGEDRGVTRTTHGGISNSQNIPGRTGEDRGISRTDHGVSRTDHSGISGNNLNPPGYASGPHANMENDRAIPIAGGEKVGSVGSADNAYGTGSSYDDSTSHGTGIGGKARNVVDKITPGRDSERSEYGASSREHGITSQSGHDSYNRGVVDADNQFSSGGQHSSVPSSHQAQPAGHESSGPAYEAGFREAMKHHEAGYKAAMDSLNRGNH